MKRNHPILRKLKSKRGETLSEVILGVLIGALALALLASMITSTSRIIRTSKTQMESYYSSQDVNLESQTTANGGSGLVTVENAEHRIVPLLRDSEKTSVDYFENTKASRPVISYRYKEN